MSLPESAELLNALSSGVFIVRYGKILQINPALSQWLGSSTGWEGKTPADLLEISGTARCALCQDTGPTFEPVHAALLKTACGDNLRVKVKHSQLPDGSVLCLVDPFSEDTTLAQAHGDFISTISHEFRTPLTSIKGFADTMLKYGGQLSEEQQRRFIHIIKEQADRMIRLTENLLTVSRLGGRRLEMSFRPVNLPHLIERVVQSVQAKLGPEGARRFSVSLHPALPEAWADVDCLEQILLNLVDNAVKYSAAGSEVKIIGTLDPDDAGQLCLQVADQGVGIPVEALPRLFTKFYRVEGPLTRQVDGTGLGLYLVKSLTASMNGKITVQSEPGVGTTFTLSLPAATPERQASHRRRLLAEQELLKGAADE